MKYLALLVLAMFLGGCDYTLPPARVYKAQIFRHGSIEEYSYKGHDYIMFIRTDINLAYAGVVHNPDCPCHKKGGNKDE